MSGHELEELAVAVGEHGVVEVELGVEVGVQRGLAEADPVSKVPQRDGGQAVATGQGPALGEDRGALRQPGGAPVDRLAVSRTSARIASLPIIDRSTITDSSSPSDACQVPCPHHATLGQTRRTTLLWGVNCPGSRTVATRDVRDLKERWIRVPRAPHSGCPGRWRSTSSPGDEKPAAGPRTGSSPAQNVPFGHDHQRSFHTRLPHRTAATRALLPHGHHGPLPPGRN